MKRIQTLLVAATCCCAVATQSAAQTLYDPLSLSVSDVTGETADKYEDQDCTCESDEP